MTRTLLGVVGVSALLIAAPLSTASAADMPLKAPPPMPVTGWSGCYVGLNAGAMLGDDHYDLSMAGGFLDAGVNLFANPANNSQLNHSYTPSPVGFAGGGQIGCNQQNGTWVYGIEADIDGASRLDTTTNYGPAGPFVGGGALLASSHTEDVTKQVDWYSTLRARLGYTVSPTWLFYVTGGLAVGEIKSSTNVQFAGDQFYLGSSTYIGSDTVTRAGWSVGAGTEWALAPNWTVKAEYLFLDFGSFSYLSPCTTAGCAAVLVPGQAQFAWLTHVRAEESVFRLGVNYKFGGPVMATY
jgi:outer membrane immunogenic protein